MALTLSQLLPGLINAGGAYYGAQQNVGNLRDATQASRTTPTNLTTSIGGAQYDPNTGFNVQQNYVGPYAGASPELIAALGGLTNTDAETQNRLAQLRTLAAPSESLAGNKALDNIFRLGQLGGTGGAIQQEAFANSLMQADRQRTLDAADWAQQRATTRFQGALQTVGAGQNQQQTDLARILGLGNLSAGAVSAPSSQLLGATAGAQAERNQGVFGALSEMVPGGLSGLLGQGASALGNVTGSSTLSRLGGLLGGSSGGGGAIPGIVGTLGGAGGSLAASMGAAGMTGLAPGAIEAGLLANTAGIPASIAGGISGAGGATGAAGATGAGAGGLGALGTLAAGAGVLGGGLAAYEGIRTGNEGMAALGGAAAGAGAGALAGLSGLAALGPIGLAAAGVAALGASLVNTKEFGDVALRNYWSGIDSGRNIGESDPTELAQGFINFYRTNKNEFPGQAVYGRTGNEEFMFDMTQKVNEAVQTGAVPPNATPGQIYETAIKPWLAGMGPGPQDEKARAVQDFMMTDLINSFMQGKPISNAQVKGDTKFRIVSQAPVYAGQVANPPAPSPAAPVMDPNNPFAGMDLSQLGLYGF